MNKLLGFYELKKSKLPSIPWEEFTEECVLDEAKLWTVRSAVISGNDLSLPRLVGAKAEDAFMFANQLKQKMGNNGVVIYYPYFIAEKSGTLKVSWNTVVIEAVKADLWNMINYSDREVTIRYVDEGEIVFGNENFLDCKEKENILRYVGVIKHMFRDELVEGKEVLLEWSFAYDSDVHRLQMGERYLLFYEIRTI